MTYWNEAKIRNTTLGRVETIEIHRHLTRHLPWAGIFSGSEMFPVRRLHQIRFEAVTEPWLKRIVSRVTIQHGPRCQASKDWRDCLTTIMPLVPLFPISSLAVLSLCS